MTNGVLATTRARKFVDGVQRYEHDDLMDFLAADPSDGYHSINYGGMPVDIRVEYRGFPTTIVFFHGAIPGEHYTLPFMPGEGVSQAAKANRIFVSDPSMAFSSVCNIAWFAGNQHQPELQSVIEEAIRHIAAFFGDQRLIFFGASGGGFASLQLASRFESSLALVANPQTSIANYYPMYVDRFVSTCFGQNIGIENLPSHVVTDVIRAYSEPQSVTIACMQNIADNFHVQKHLQPMMRAMHPENTMMLLAGDWGEGHAPPHKEVFASMLNIFSELPWDEALRQSGFVSHTDSPDFRP